MLKLEIVLLRDAKPASWHGGVPVPPQTQTQEINEKLYSAPSLQTQVLTFEVSPSDSHRSVGVCFVSLMLVAFLFKSPYRRWGQDSVGKQFPSIHGH